MTIPNLVQTYQSRAWETAATTFNRKLGEALKVMNTQETLAGYSSTEAFVNELSKHLKITKTCDNKNLTACFDNKVMWGEDEVDISELSTSADMGHDDWKTNIVGFQMANGVTGLVAYNPACTQDPYNNRHIDISGSIKGRKGSVAFPGTDCIAMVYDVTGYGKPNTKEKDISGNVTTLAKAKACDAEFGGSCWTVVGVPTPMTRSECAGGESEVPNPPAGEEAKKLGIKECYALNDYWAGAVKACGGTSKMPTIEQLAQLATQIYGEEIGVNDYKGGLQFADRALFDALSGDSSDFAVWSSQENAAYSASFRIFRSGLTIPGGGTRTISSNIDRIYAVCLAD